MFVTRRLIVPENWKRELRQTNQFKQDFKIERNKKHDGKAVKYKQHLKSTNGQKQRSRLPHASRGVRSPEQQKRRRNDARLANRPRPPSLASGRGNKKGQGEHRCSNDCLVLTRGLGLCIKLLPDGADAISACYHGQRCGM